MSTKTNHSSQPALYYITFTCYRWLPLFQLVNGYDLIYNWFNVLKEKYGIKTTAYTIMPNHIHCILFFPHEDYDLNKLVANGKRFIAYEIIKRLAASGQHGVLLQLKEGLTSRDIKKGQQHKVFEDSFDAKPIYHRSFLLQKINYIHLNAVRGKWRLTAHWEDYEHSSAPFYVRNNQEGFVPVHYEALS